MLHTGAQSALGSALGGIPTPGMGRGAQREGAGPGPGSFLQYPVHLTSSSPRTQSCYLGPQGLAPHLAQRRAHGKQVWSPQDVPLTNGWVGSAERSNWPFKNNPRRGSKCSQAEAQPQILAGLGPRREKTPTDTRRPPPGQIQHSAWTRALSKLL